MKGTARVVGRVVQWGALPVGLALNVISLYFDSQDARRFGWDWRIWAAIGTALILASAASIIGGLYVRLWNLESRPRPHLVFGEPHVTKVSLTGRDVRVSAINISHDRYSTDDVVPIANNRHERITSRPHVAQAVVSNDPSNRCAEATAKHAVVTLEFFRFPLDSASPCLTINGRWTQNPQPGTRDIYAPIDDIRRRDLLPNGEPNYIDIALKRLDDGACYAFNDETCRTFPDWHDPKLRLTEEQYKVVIRIRAVGLEDKEGMGCVYLRNGGSGERLDIGLSPITAPALATDT
jgi:hypothetical protein